MAKAIAVLVGLKSLDPDSYEGWAGENGCWGCELDVDNMAQILDPLGYKIRPLKTASATRKRVLDELHKAASSLKRGDTFVFYYSGHGGSQPDLNGDEMDGKDETLCVYDGELIDDQLNEVWLKFRSGVRIVMISDSCNSGTNYRLMRNVPASFASPVKPVDPGTANEMKAQMIHMGGCRDGGTSDGYNAGGAFTMALCNAWNGGRFDGNYRQLLETIRRNVSNQVPQYNEYGPVTDEFRDEKPFTAEPSDGGGGGGELKAGRSVVGKGATGELVGRRFTGKRGEPGTRAAGGAVAKYTYVRRVIDYYLAGKLAADPGIRLGDAMYYLPTMDEMRQLLQASSVDRRQWLEERFDCDDFAYVLKGEGSVHAYDAGNIRYGLCLGIMWGNFSWLSAYHAINWFVDSQGKLYLIEPQTDEIYESSDCRGGVGLVLV